MRRPVANDKGVQKIDPTAFSYPIMGRLRADAGEKRTPGGDLKPGRKQIFVFRHLPIPQTGALAAAESGLRLLT